MLTIYRKFGEYAWNKSIEREIAKIIKETEKEIASCSKEMKRTFKDLFVKAAVGVTVGAAPVVLCTFFPALTPSIVLLLGGLAPSGLLKKPFEGLVEKLISGKKKPSALASYYMQIGKMAHQT